MTVGLVAVERIVLEGEMTPWLLNAVDGRRAEDCAVIRTSK